MASSVDPNTSSFRLPEWLIDYEKTCKEITFKDSDSNNAESKIKTDKEKMKIAIEVSKQSVLRKTGGPFGCAIFQVSEDGTTSKLFCLGSNLVTTANNCTLHGEMVAIQVGCKRLNDFSFSNKTSSSTGNYELFTSCEPCAMCLGAILWSGVKRVVCGASKVDAENIGFDEGPVFDESYTYMSNHGVTIEREVLRKDAAAVLNLYASDEGNTIYNGKS